MAVEQWTEEEWKRFERKLEALDYPKEMTEDFVKKVNELIEQTRGQEEHPEWYDSPCICDICLDSG
jgi:hypothetical protein